jgi:hypothetical protein
MGGRAKLAPAHAHAQRGSVRERAKEGENTSERDVAVDPRRGRRTLSFSWTLILAFAKTDCASS